MPMSMRTATHTVTWAPRWYPAILKSGDSRTAHILKPGTTVPLCNCKPYGMGGGFDTAMEAGCMECGKCATIARKLGAHHVRTPAKYVPPKAKPVPAEDKCESCEGRGWLLIESGRHGHQIQACDCGHYVSDDLAAEACQFFINRAIKAGIK